MIIKLNSYNDLGKCSMGTLLDKYDTEKNHIFIQVKPIKNFKDYENAFAEVKINNAKDLVRWLWCIAGVSYGNDKNEQCWFFNQCEDWWNSEFKGRIAEYDCKSVKMKKKIEKLPGDSKAVSRIQKKLEFYDTTSLKKYIADLDIRKNEIVNLLIKENQ